MPFNARRSFAMQSLNPCRQFQGKGLCISNGDVQQSDKLDCKVPQKDLVQGNYPSVHIMVVLVFPSI